MIAVRPKIAGHLCLLAVMHLGGPADAQERPGDVRPGKDFQSAETRALQEDETRNPGMLWVEQGAKLWDEPGGTSGKSCASCHGAAETSMKGVAARYPRVVWSGGDVFTPEVIPHVVVTLDKRVDTCRALQGERPFSPESREQLSLTSYLAYQSRGMSRALSASPGSVFASQAVLQYGRNVFQSRQGQLNLSCAQCHDDLVGKKLRGDTISQAQTHGWPAYRLEWQTMGSLQRRLRACSLGVRAEVHDYGHPDYLALELYLAWRGEGLPMESPGVRR
jgi:L-cysteine S-thiosulfotransferase